MHINVPVTLVNIVRNITLDYVIQYPGESTILAPDSDETLVFVPADKIAIVRQLLNDSDFYYVVVRELP